MKYCVIGLGQFGEALTRALAEDGREVIAIDDSETNIARVRDIVTIAAQIDARDLEALRELGVADCDVGIVAIGDHFEDSLVATAHLKELGVERIHCRTLGPVHGRLLDLLGITEKIEAEAIAARQLAKRLGIHRAVRHFNITNNYVIVELEAPPRLIGKTVAESRMRQDYKLNLITIRRAEETKGDAGIERVGIPGPETPFAEGDRLLIFGREEDLQRFSQK